MQNIINDYIDYREVDKELFKEFLNDIFITEKKIKENRGKKLINQEEVDGDIKNTMFKGGEYFEKEGITKKELDTLTDEVLYKEVFGIKDRKKQTLIGFNVYKGSIENNKNDNIYAKRILILDKLVDNGVISISPFNVVKEFNDSDKNNIDFVREMMSEQKEKFREKFGEAVAERQIKGLKGKEKYFQFIVYEKREISKLLKLINEADVKELQFNNGALFYGGKVAYVPSKKSARVDFLTYFFERDIDEGISLEELYIYIEGVHGSIDLNDKEKDKIYNLKRSLNTKIEQETGIKDFFYFKNTEFKGLIYRKY